MKQLLDTLNNRYSEIDAWLAQHEQSNELPLYSSVDIRDAGFKMSVVDTNLFPAGFNNLCEHGVADAAPALRKAILDRVENCESIMVIAEEHTRNAWYLENIRILKNIIEAAGFTVMIGTFLDVQPEFCNDCLSIELETATGETVKLYSMNRLCNKLGEGSCNFDLIIMNNDLTTGIPDILRDACAPIYPSISAGWHSRQKSHHFAHTADLMADFAEMAGVDPWLLTCLDQVIDDVDINDADHRERLQDSASDLFARITKKYDEHGIDSKPFIFLKADSGTYGMGVMPIEDPSELTSLNRRGRNKLAKGKSSQSINRYLLQEGVPTISSYGEQVAEACLYQIANTVVGGFYRMHDDKNVRENLNSKGMTFQAICPRLSKYGDCGAHTENNIFDVYRILARIAGIAAHREIIQLETAVAP